MTPQMIATRKREAIQLIRKGGLSAQIGLRFLSQHITQ